MADPNDRKAMLLEKYNAASEEEEEAPAGDEPADDAPVDEPAPEPEASADDALADETAEEKPAGRDDKGRFAARAKDAAKAASKPAAAPKSATPVVAPVADAKPAAAKPVAAAAPPVELPKPGSELKPPQSWTPAAREAWKDVPPAARQEIHRLEGETRRVLQENATIRRDVGEHVRFRQGVEGFVRPYEGIFRSQGLEPMQGVANVVQTYAALHLGTPQQKASILASLLSQFSDVDSVNAALQGQPAPTGAPAPVQQQAPVDIQAAIQAGVTKQFQTLQQQALSTRAERDLEAFQATTPEFLNDVWDDMVVIIDANAARGRNLTYQQAYDHACKMDERIQGVLEQRKAAEAATSGSATAPAQRARSAAATVRSRPAAVGTPVDLTDRRALIGKFARGT